MITYILLIIVAGIIVTDIINIEFKDWNEKRKAKKWFDEKFKK